MKESDAFFPVKMKPVYIRVQDDTLFQEKGSSMFATPKFKAIVDVERNYFFSLVGNEYRLVINEEAIELGRNCFGTVFSKTVEKDMDFST